MDIIELFQIYKDWLAEVNKENDYFTFAVEL